MRFPWLEFTVNTYHVPEFPFEFPFGGHFQRIWSYPDQVGVGMQVKTIESIVASLPNGFEDCFIRAVHLDVTSRSAYFDTAVIIKRNWGGASEFRVGRLSAFNVHVSFVEPPAPTYPFLFEGKAISASLDLELNGMNNGTEQIISSVPSNAEVIRLFLHDWNSFLYLAADSFTFTWLEQEVM